MCSGIRRPQWPGNQNCLDSTGFCDELLFLCRGEGPRRTDLETRGAPEGLHVLPGCTMAEKAQLKPNAKAGDGQSMAPASFLPVTHKVISTAPNWESQRAMKCTLHRNLNSLDSFSTLSFAQLHHCTAASDTTCALPEDRNPTGQGT